MKIKQFCFAHLLAASLLIATASAQETKVSTPADKQRAIDTVEFESPVRLMVGDSPIQVESPGYACPGFADMDGDDLKDLLVGQFAGGKIRVFKNLGKQGFGEGQWLKADGDVAEVPGVW